MKLSPRVLIGEEALRRRVGEMAAQIAAGTPEGVPLSVLALLDGAFVFCADLLRSIPRPARLALVPVPSVDRGGDPAAVRLPADFPVRGSDLLVVEDILDTGRTLSALVAHLRTLDPARIRVAVLLDKPAGRKVPFVPDLVGFTVEDVWVVGYGLDSGGLYRTLPYVGFMEP